MKREFSVVAVNQRTDEEKRQLREMKAEHAKVRRSIKWLIFIEFIIAMVSAGIFASGAFIVATIDMEQQTHILMMIVMLITLVILVGLPIVIRGEVHKLHTIQLNILQQMNEVYSRHAMNKKSLVIVSSDAKEKCR